MRAKTDGYTILPYAHWKTNKQQKYKHAHKAPNIFLVIISVIHLVFTVIPPTSPVRLVVAVE